MSDSQGRGSGSSTPVKPSSNLLPSPQVDGSNGNNTSTSTSIPLSQTHLPPHAVAISSLPLSAQQIHALQHGGMMSQAVQRAQTSQPQSMPTHSTTLATMGQQQIDQHAQHSTPQLHATNPHDQQQQSNQSPIPPTNIQQQNTSLSQTQQQPQQPNPQQQQQTSGMLLQNPQHSTGGPSGPNSITVSMQQQQVATAAALMAQQNVAGVIHHAQHHQQQNSANLHTNSQSLNTSNTLSVPQNAVMVNQANPQQQQVQASTAQQQHHQATGQPQSMGPPVQPHPQHQNPAIVNQGNMVRVSMPIQNIPQGMQGVQTIQSIAGMQGMQPIQQIQQLQNVQQIQGMPQMQGLQQIQGLPQVQGVQQMQPLQGVQGLQGVQVLGPMQNFQGSQFLAQHQYLPPMFQNQLQAQMVSPAINLQNMQGAPKSPGIPLQQQQQPLQIQQQPQQPTPQQQQAMVNTQGPSSGATTPTKSAVPVSRPSIGPQQQQQQTVNIQQQGQQPQMQGQPQQGGMVGQMKQVVQPQQQQQQQQQQRPVVIGVIANQPTGNQPMINQPKSPIIAQGSQVISNQQIRFSNQPTIVNSNGQLVQPVMSMNQFQATGNLQQNMSLAQPIFATQGGPILSQPVYIRTAAPLQQQQGICVQIPPGIKPKDVKPGMASLPQGARTIGPGLQTVPVGQTIRLRPPPVAPRVIKPQKNTPPRTIQPKPPSSISTGISSLPTAMVSPKPGTSKPAQTLTKVVTCTTSPRVAPTESQPCNSIVNTIKKGASLVSKALSNPNIADSSTSEPVVIEDKTPPPIFMDKENVKKEETPMNNNISSTTTSALVTTTIAPTFPVTTTVSNISSPLSSLEPKGPPGTDFVVSRTAERKQAIVKPVLTHVIEGFVIQEASEPFPVHRSHMMDNLSGSKQQEVDMEIDKSNIQSEQQSDITAGDMRCCELCKKQLPANKIKAAKRFCSNVCAKRYNVGCTKRVGLFRGNNIYDKYSNRKRQPSSSKDKDVWSRTEDGGRITTGPIKRGDTQQPITLSLSGGTSSQSEDDSNHIGGGIETSSEAEETESHDASTSTDGGSSVVVQEEEEIISPARSPPELERVDEMVITPPASQAVEAVVTPQRRKPLQQWNVHEVSSFINSLPGCGMYADMFSSQEIDGQALMLLKEDHLMTAMNIKLGPALKICASIKQILEES